MLLKKDFRFSVSEIYGPVVQGEGYELGVPTIFIRFGGCDFRCSWCDSLYAVLPQYKDTWEKLTADEIMERLAALDTHIKHVTLSGGNPAIQPAEGLVDKLHASGYIVSVETQGTVRPDWLSKVDYVTVSPKPPSSGNVTSLKQLEHFFELWKWTYAFEHAYMQPGTFEHCFLKIVVFDDEDYAYAQTVVEKFTPYMRTYLQVGTYQDPTTFSKERVLSDLLTLQEKALADPIMYKTRVLAQMHTLLYGLRRGI